MNMESKLFRKLAAVGAGAVALAAAFAVGGQIVPSNVDSGFFWNASGTNFNIVVGANAHPLDGVNAARIAIAAAAKTYKSEEKAADCTSTAGTTTACTVDEASKSVTINVGGSTTSFTDGRSIKKSVSNWASGTNEWPDENVTSTDTKVLHRESSKEFDYNNGTTYTINVEEKLRITADGWNDEDYISHQDGHNGLYAKLSTNALRYILDFGGGLQPFNNLNASKDDDSKTKPVIWFMGSQYEILKATVTVTPEIQLATSSGKTTIFTGDEAVSFTQGDTTFKTKLVSVKQSSGTSTYTGTFELYDNAGNLLTTVSVDPNTTTDFSGKLKNSIVIRDIEQVVGGENAGKGRAEMQFTGTILKLQDGKSFPNDTKWDISMTTSGGKITLVTIKNSSVSFDTKRKSDITSDRQSVLYVGDSAEFPSGFAIVNFKGFADETLYTVTIGDGKISYRNANDSDKAIDLSLWARNIVKVNGTEWKVRDTNTSNNTYKFGLAGDDKGDLHWLAGDANWMNVDEVYSDPDADYQLDGNRLISTLVYKTNGRTLGDDSWPTSDVEYGSYLDSSDVYFLLRGSGLTGARLYDDASTADINFVGTDLNNDPIYNGDRNADINKQGGWHFYYIPAVSGVVKQRSTNDAARGKYAALFVIQGGHLNAGNEFDVVLDTFNDKLADGTSSSNTFPSAMGVSEVRYAANSGNDGFSLKRNADSVTTNIQKGWDIEGDYTELVERSEEHTSELHSQFHL